MPGNPPLPAALPAPFPLPRVVPAPAPEPPPAVVPRPDPVPSATPAGFRPLPFALPYRPPVPVPEPVEFLAALPPAAASATASPLGTSAGVPVPAAMEGWPPPLLPAPGSAITVTSPGATANNERASAWGIFLGASGGGGTALSTSSACFLCSTGTSDTCAGAGMTGFAGSNRGTMGSDASRAGAWLAAATGNVIFGARTGFSAGARSDSSPANTFLTGFGGSATATSAGCAMFGNGRNCFSSGGLISAG